MKSIQKQTLDSAKFDSCDSVLLESELQRATETYRHLQNENTSKLLSKIDDAKTPHIKQMYNYGLVELRDTDALSRELRDEMSQTHQSDALNREIDRRNNFFNRIIRARKKADEEKILNSRRTSKHQRIAEGNRLTLELKKKE